MKALYQCDVQHFYCYLYILYLVVVELYCFSMSQIQQAHIVMKYTNRKHLCKNHKKFHFNDTHIIHKCCNNLILSESYSYSRHKLPGFPKRYAVAIQYR